MGPQYAVARRAFIAGIPLWTTLIGLWLVNYGDETTGTTLVIASCTYMLLASLFMGAADLLGYWRPRGGSKKGTLASSLLPALALIALAIQAR